VEDDGEGGDIGSQDDDFGDATVERFCALVGSETKIYILA